MALETRKAGGDADGTYNNTFDRTAGSRALAAAGQRDRWTDESFPQACW